MTGRNSAISSVSAPKTFSKSGRNARHPTTRKRPGETRRAFAPHNPTFGVSGCRRYVRLGANARKYYDFSDACINLKCGVISGTCVADDAVRREPVSGAEFPVIREFNREFREFGPSFADFRAELAQKFKPLRSNSLCERTGNLNCGNREILFRNQGIRE